MPPRSPNHPTSVSIIPELITYQLYCPSAVSVINPCLCHFFYHPAPQPSSSSSLIHWHYLHCATSTIAIYVPTPFYLSPYLQHFHISATLVISIFTVPLPLSMPLLCLRCRHLSTSSIFAPETQQLCCSTTTPVSFFSVAPVISPSLWLNCCSDTSNISIISLPRNYPLWLHCLTPLTYPPAIRISTLYPPFLIYPCASSSVLLVNI